MGAGKGGFVATLAAAACLSIVPAAGRDVASNVSTTALAVEQTSHSPQHKQRRTLAEEDASDPDLAKADALIQKQNLADAEPLLRKLVEKDPQNYVGWFDLGFVENGLGKTEDSIAAYRKSVDAKPDVFESNLNLGLQLAKAKNPEAEKFLRAATQLKPTSEVAEGQARAWLSLAHVLEKSTPDNAIAAYARAAALQPNNIEPHLAAGLLLENQNNFADAEREYKQAQQIDPASTDAAVGLANIYMRGRRFLDAGAELRKVLAAHPDQAAARIQLGRVLAAEGKYDEAIAQLQEGSKQAPNDVSLQRDLADLYSLSGKNDDAEKTYRDLVAAHPNEAELHHSLGQALLRTRKFPQAQEEFLAAIKLKPGLSAAYGDLAFAANENKNYPLAIKALDARAKLLPEMPITYFLRASAYDHLKDVKRATANYHLFLQSANGKYPDQEWQAKHRLIALEPKR